MAMVCNSVSRVQKWLFCVDFCGHRSKPPCGPLVCIQVCGGTPLLTICSSFHVKVKALPAIVEFFLLLSFLAGELCSSKTCVSQGGCLPSLFALEMMTFGWAAGQRKTCFLFGFRRLFCLLGGNQWFMVLWLLTSGHQAF